MREHAVPQNVTSYEFHLIGNMTLKQFLELAAGIVLAIIVYRTNLPEIIKIPIAIVSAGIGAMIAFVPFEGRPLDRWFIAFVRAIYKPTEFYWRKDGKIPSYLTYTPLTTTTSINEVDLTPYKRQRIMEFINTLPAPSKLDLINMEENQRINTLTNLFDEVEVTHDVVTATPLEPEKPPITLEPHVLKPIDQILNADNPLPPKPPIELVQDDMPQADAFTSTEIPNEPIPMVMDEVQPSILEPVAPETDQRTDVQIPDMPAISVSPASQSAPTTDTQSLTAVDTSVDIFSANQPLAQSLPPDQVATTSTTLPFPQRPTLPNLIVGMVFDPQGKIVDNAIVEITDMESMPVRAVKTNSIGQFLISTPLKDGNYIVSTEKNGLHFPTMSIELKNTILDPLSITADSIQTTA